MAMANHLCAFCSVDYVEIGGRKVERTGIGCRRTEPQKATRRRDKGAPDGDAVQLQN
jgi:hypothetical protein